MMSKKDYKAIATVLKEAKEDFEGGTLTELVLENIEYNLCNYFASTNPRFDVDRFIAACEIPFDYDKFLTACKIPVE